MYVKVPHGGPAGTDFLTPITGPVNSGRITINYAAAIKNNDMAGAVAQAVGEVVLMSEGGTPQAMPFNHVHVLQVEPEALAEPTDKDMAVVRFIWWDEPGDGLHAVITTRPIYILGDNGRTIDRVG